MKTIYKYELPVGPGIFKIPMPEGAVILCVQLQQNRPALWAHVDPDAPMKERIIRVFGTGHDIPEEPLRYIGTYQMMMDMLVWHVWVEE